MLGHPCSCRQHLGLLPDKEYSTYRAVLEYLKDEEDVGAPTLCHLDFEAGDHMAFRDVYPSTNIVGCDFHWMQVVSLNL